MSSLGADPFAPGSGTRTARRLAGTETDAVGLPHQGKQILIDNLTDRDHGTAKAAIASQPGHAAREWPRNPPRTGPTGPPRLTRTTSIGSNVMPTVLESSPSVVAAPAFVAGAQKGMSE